MNINAKNEILTTINNIKLKNKEDVHLVHLLFYCILLVPV